MNSSRPLHDGWSVSAGSDTPISVVAIPATVPGCVHTDLLAADLIPDPYLDDNEARLGWIGRTEWRYETTFDWAPGDWAPDNADRVDLVCGGLDTVATVRLNRTEVGHTENMHRSYRFDVRSILRSGANELSVVFAAPYAYAEAQRDRLGDRPCSYAPEPFNFIRKMASNFGWDWGPTVVTSGIWQPIGLHAWSTARLAEVRPLVTVAGTTGRVEVTVDIERATPVPLTLTIAVGGHTTTTTATVESGAVTATVTVEVPDVRRWWPRGYGDQPRYDLTVTLATAEASLDSWTRKIGFRSLALDTAPDADGSAFRLIVNDTPVFVRGANWIPDDSFLNRVTRDRYQERLEQGAAAGVNLLRVWGGGRYESEDFYDLADELGILVSQDFLFACAAYPEEEPFATEVAAEAREHVVRLMAHPSLVLWIGNNENFWGWHDWGWQERLAGKSWGLGYYLTVLPQIVAELDPTRPYWPGSPYSASPEPGSPGRHPNDMGHGTCHIWDVWNTDDYRRYLAWRPRFVAEFGFCGPPAWATLRRAVSDDPITPTSPGVRHHQKAKDGENKLRRGLAAHFGEPGDVADWHWATQLNQSRAIQLGIEHFRSLRPLCSGVILWQLNDQWPVVSWAAVDGDARRKPLWYTLRRVYADRLLTVQPRGGGLAVVAVNDGRTEWRTQFDVVRYSFAGSPRAKTSVSLGVAPGGAVTVPLPPELSTPDDPGTELLVVDSDAGRSVYFFAEDLRLRYPPPDFDVAVTPGGSGYTVEVTARSLLRDVALFPDRLDPASTVDDLLVTLLPGETATFSVRSDRQLDPAALATSPVLRCANDLFGGAVE